MESPEEYAEWAHLPLLWEYIPFLEIVGKIPVYNLKMSASPTPPGQPVLEQVLTMLQPLVVWLLRSGVGYTDLTAALKPVFLEAARTELTRIGGKQTDSAVSLLSGLHRKDVRAAIRLGLPYAHDRSEPLAIRGNADTGYTADVVLAVTFKTPPPKDHHAR